MVNNLNKTRVLCVFGTRPEAIKMAPVVKALRTYPESIDCRVCVTAQHRELLDQVLQVFGIIPDLDLNLMTPGQTLAKVTSRVLLGMEEIIKQEQPDWVLVQGDTTTVMATSLAAFYHQVKVGHIEAGLRTWNKYHPFPEEINRKIAGTICDLHFAPTNMTRDNLLGEGVPETTIRVTGNTVIDALLEVAGQAFDVAGSVLRDLPFDKRIILVTAHRRENFGQPIHNICRALSMLARQYSSDVHLVYPVHPNPNVQQPVYALLSGIKNITLLPPLPYRSFVYLMKQAHLILTDSGGLQEEAPSLNKPVLVLREVTERLEAVKSGTVQVVGTNSETIIAAATKLLKDSQAYRKLALAQNPYGDGQASQRIVQAILTYPDQRSRE